MGRVRGGSLGGTPVAVKTLLTDIVVCVPPARTAVEERERGFY